MKNFTESLLKERKRFEDYRPYFENLAEYMVKEGYTKKPLPTIHCICKKGLSDDPFAPTANYDPDRKVVNLYVCGRAIKDVLRSFAHELIHHRQNLEGRLKDDAYSGTEIINDDKLQKLECEAYLQGNISFRSWTEIMKNK